MAENVTDSLAGLEGAGIGPAATSVADVVNEMYTKNKMSGLRKPVWSLAVLAICLIASIYTCRGSSEDLGVWGGELFDRFFEQIPLSILFGYLLFRTINPLTGKSGGWNWPMLLFYLAGGLTAGFILMHEVSHFAGDDVVTENKRREKITQIGAQSLVFGLIFMWLGNGKSSFPFLNREPGRANANGNVRMYTMYLLFLVLLCCISANDIHLMMTSEEKDKHVITGFRVVQYIIVLAILANATVSETQIQKATSTKKAFGNLINLASTDSLAQASPMNAQSGYEI